MRSLRGTRLGTAPGLTDTPDGCDHLGSLSMRTVPPLTEVTPLGNIEQTSVQGPPPVPSHLEGTRVPWRQKGQLGGGCPPTLSRSPLVPIREWCSCSSGTDPS